MNGFDPIPVLMVSSLLVITLHIYLTVKRLVAARWSRRLKKRYVPRREMWLYRIQLVSLGLLGVGILALVFLWKAQPQ